MYLDYNMRPVNLSDKGDDSEVFAYWIPRTNTVILNLMEGMDNLLNLLLLLTRKFNCLIIHLAGWDIL